MTLITEQTPMLDEALIQAALNLWGRVGKQSLLPVHGQSMFPLLQEGDQILLDYNVSKIRFGDILVYRQADQLVVHRVIRIIRNGERITKIITKGDNNLPLDPLVQPEQVIGWVISIRKAGRIIRLDTFPWRAAGWAAAAIGRAAVLILGLLHLNHWASHHAGAIVWITALPLRVAVKQRFILN